MVLCKFLDPKNDIAFKKIFGSEKNKDILIHFLNDILNPQDKIIDLEFLSTIQDPEIASKKQSIVDVLCRDSKGVQIIIEMQVAQTKGFEKRAQYYAAKAYSGQADKGGKYYSLKEIIFIAIADCVLFPDKKEYKSDHIILDKNTYDHDLKDFSFTFIELPKFLKTKETQLETMEEKWIYFFKYADETSEEDLNKIIGSDEIIKKAYEELNRFNWSEKEYIAYEREIKRIRDNEAVLELQLDNAERKGRQEGEQIGIEKGRQEGEKNAAMKFAKGLKEDGMSMEKIMKLTGLSKEEIQDL
jgi:predicted transposase/invertase (TIGR01784 family)